MKKLWVICLIICFTLTTFAQQKEETAKLAVKKVILYSHGMGYFERQGIINGTQDIELEFTTSQMNDVLKSLLLLDLNGGQVSTVTYNTAKPINKQLENFAINLSANKAKSLTTLVGQLIGTKVEVKTSSSSVEGKVIGLEERQQQQANNIIKIESLVISTDTGMLQSFDFTDIKGIRIIDRKIRSDVEQYLEILNTSHKKTARNLVINAQGSGARNIVAGYTIEAPVWKTSYRVVLDEKGKPFIQGWAIVDNEQDEDWENVQLSLVSGLPVSFTQNLDSARYYTRPEVAYKQQVALAPQSYEDNIGIQSGVEGGVAGGVAGGVVGGVVGSTSSYSPPPPPIPPHSGPTVKPKPVATRTYEEGLENSATNNTSGNDVGDLFEYKINLPVTIRHNSSALIPIVNSKLEGERVSIFNAYSSIKNPMSGVLLKNTTNLTLESGPLTVFEGSTYAGESLLDRVKPGEKRYLTFAADLGTFITTIPESSKDRVYLVKSEKGSLVLLSKQLETKTYTIVNKDNRAKTVIIEHPRRQYWDVKSPASKEVFEATENFLRFRVSLEAKATVKLPVVEEQILERAYQISNISSEDISLFISQKYINEETRKKLQSIIDVKRQIAATDSEIYTKNTQLSRIATDQARLRENIKAIGKSEEEKKLLARYTQKLNDTEDQLEKLNIEIKTLEEAKTKQQQELNKIIMLLDGYENKIS